MFQAKVLTGPFSYLILSLILLLSTSCDSVLVLLLLSPTSPYHRSHFCLWHSISLSQIPIISSQFLSQPLHPANNLSFPLNDSIFLILLSRIPSCVSWFFASGQKEFDWLTKVKVFKSKNFNMYLNVYFKNYTCALDRLKRDINLYMLLWNHYIFSSNQSSIFSEAVMLQNKTPHIYHSFIGRWGGNFSY